MTSRFSGSVRLKSVNVLRKLDIAFDASTVHGSFAKGADYMAAVAELIRLTRAS